MTPTLWITLVALGLGLKPETDVACEYVATYAYDRAEACQGDDCPDMADGAYEDTMVLCFAAVDGGIGAEHARAFFLALAGEAGQ